MQEVNSASPVLPVLAATPAQGSNVSTSASQGNDGQAAFAQLLRDKQAAAAATANSDSKAQDTTSRTAGNADAKEQTDTTTSEAVAKTPAEMAQLLAAAGLLANAGSAKPTDASASDTTTEQLAALAAMNAASKTAADTGVATNPSASDKTAANGAATTAGLAASTANMTTAGEQALALQARSELGNKGAQSGASGGDQQSPDKQHLIAGASQTDGDKSRAEATNSEGSFAAALERASQAGDASHGGIAAAGSIAPAQSAHAPVATHTVNTPVGRQGWADEVGQRVLWTAKSDSNRADLVLTPPQLGRIEVSIHMNGDQASASFMAANPVAREALQDAMPRLRELMSQAGIQLGQADVSAGQSGQNGAQSGRRQGGGGVSGGMLGVDGAIGTTASSWARQGAGIVDTFA